MVPEKAPQWIDSNKKLFSQNSLILGLGSLSVVDG
jgi:hypothetical protein